MNIDRVRNNLCDAITEGGKKCVNNLNYSVVIGSTVFGGKCTSFCTGHCDVWMKSIIDNLSSVSIPLNKTVISEKGNKFYTDEPEELLLFDWCISIGNKQLCNPKKKGYESVLVDDIKFDTLCEYVNNISTATNIIPGKIEVKYFLNKKHINDVDPTLKYVDTPLGKFLLLNNAKKYKDGKREGIIITLHKSFSIIKKLPKFKNIFDATGPGTGF